MGRGEGTGRDGRGRERRGGEGRGGEERGEGEGGVLGEEVDEMGCVQTIHSHPGRLPRAVAGSCRLPPAASSNSN